MKKFIYIIIFIVSAIIFASCSNKYNELFSITDEFVESLDTTYESYGLFGGVDETKYTADQKYKIFPIGRLINVRIEKTTTDEEYENLCKVLEKHYAKDSRVNSVYRCQAGTLMIDCRE